MPFEVQGHRGMRGHYPENTLPGFVAAIEAHVPVIECDILATSDGVLVLYHDFAIRRNHLRDTGPLLISLTLEEVKQIECGTVDPEFPDQIPCLGARIPTLDELLTLVKQTASVRLNLEIKRDASKPTLTLPPEWLAKTLLSQVQSRGLEKRVYYSSFDYEVLRELRKLDSNVDLGLLYCERGMAKLTQRSIPQSILEQAEELQITTFSPKHSYLKTKDQIEALQKRELRIIPWTVNDPRRWQQLIEMGVDGVITDYPTELLELIQREREM